MRSRLAGIRLRRRERRLARLLEQRFRSELDAAVTAAARLADELTAG